MKRGKFMPSKSKLNSNKKTKVQFSTRFSKCLGEHQCQEFFERLNITRQTGICSKSKTNSFGDNKSHSFRQTLHLNIPFIADFSDLKEFCICYPVHFFRKKLQNNDYEDCRLASVRIYYPASRMKSGNDFKVCADHKKRIHLNPHQFEFVAYPNLLTLSLEDLALAVFRAKSLSEKFKNFHSLPVPKILLSTNSVSSQTGSPIFIATERIYSRLCKLIACSSKTSFPLNNSSTNNSDADFYSKTCILKWVGVSDFLPLASRLIFVRRVSVDCGDTLSSSILNSSGPKIRRSRIKGDRFSIRLKQSKVCMENEDPTMKLLIEPTASLTETDNSNSQSVKRSRGRPKKPINIEEKIVSEYSDDNCNTAGLLIGSSNNSDKLKTESISNSLFDSTSEEKYSIQLSSCSTPDTIKSHSPNVSLNASLSAAINSTVSMCQLTATPNTNNSIKNRRGLKRKQPSIVQDESYIRLTLSKNKRGDFEVLSKGQDQFNLADGELPGQKMPSTDCSMGLFGDIPRKPLESSFSSGDMSKKEMSLFLDSTKSCEKTQCFLRQSNIAWTDLSVHSMWKPLKHALLPPDPVVPFSKSVSSTGLATGNREDKTKRSATPDDVPCDKSTSINFASFQSSFSKMDENIDRNLSAEFPQSQKLFTNSNLLNNKHNFTKFSVENKILFKENTFNKFYNNEKINIEHNNNHLNSVVIIPPSPTIHRKHDINPSYHNDDFFFPNQPITNNLQLPFLPVINLHPPPIFSSTKYLSDQIPLPSVSSSNQPHLSYPLENPMFVTSAPPFSYPQNFLTNHRVDNNSSNIFGNGFDPPLNPLWSWNNAFQWKY